MASEPGVGVTRGGFSRRGQRRGQRFGEVLLRGERVLTGHPVLIELLHALLAHLFALTNRRQAAYVFMYRVKKKRRADHIKVRCTDKKLLDMLGQSRAQVEMFVMQNEGWFSHLLLLLVE